MPLHMMIGRAGSGKSTAIINQITAQLRENPAGNPIILIVPEQASFQAETEMIRSHGMNGSVRVQVLDFRRLSFESDAGNRRICTHSNSGRRQENAALQNNAEAQG